MAEKRIRMYEIFQETLEKATGETGVEGLEELENSSGYLYKLSQEFLLSSSTYEKEKKLEKMLETI